jgi:hypothetical protein
LIVEVEVASAPTFLGDQQSKISNQPSAMKDPCLQPGLNPGGQREYLVKRLFCCFHKRLF